MRLSIIATVLAAGVFATSSAAQFSSIPTTQTKGQPTAQKGQKVQPTKQQLASLTAPLNPVPAGVSFLVSGSDNCANAAVSDAITGPGVYAVDNTVATTGSPVASCGAMGNDVWFYYTCTLTSTVSVTTCAQVAGDSVIAVWADGAPAGSCPTTQIACIDDACGLQTTTSFAGVAGSKYFINIGGFGGSTYSGTFTISQNVASGNDDCSGATVITGTGSFPANTIGATSSPQQNGSCAFANQDIWFSWVAPMSGVAILDTCGGGVDTVVAAWAGSGCTATPLACSDDGCGFPDSRATFAVTAGSNYMLQIGGFGATTYNSFFNLNVSLPPANDGCATPTIITGAGPHAFDTTLATTGTEGQTEGICTFFGSTANAFDTWYTWTAPASGLTVLSFCAGSSGDTKVAVYAGAGCPAPGTAIACNDDKCGLTSELCFTATAGATYTIQVGNYPFAAGGSSGTFTLVGSAGGGTNDDCATPTVISGLGPHNFDTTVATTGCQGQDNTACTFFGTTSLETDVWFTWTAPASGLFQVSLCGTAGGFDSKVAVYAGAGCPASNSAIACDDDGCGTIAGESKACFTATAGATYTIEVGAFPGAGGTTGTFSFSAVAAPTGCQYDNGTSENAVGLTAGGAMMWMHHFGSVGGSSTVNSVKSAFGTPLFPGGTPPVGTPVVATVYNDPTNDNDPTDAVLLQQAPGVVGNIDNDVFDTFAVTPQATSGIYFVGVSISHASGQFPAPLDQDNCPAGSAGRAWVVGDTTGTINLTTLSANNVPPLEMDSIGLPGVWLLRADCTGSVGTAGCFGDGTGTACPCGNNSTVAGTGCQHSFSASLYGGSGAKLAGTGGASLSADTVQLQATTLPPSTTCLFFQGTTAISVVFGDGLRCAGGTVTRLGQRPVSGGARNFGEGVAGDPEIHTVGLVLAPGTREYQNWFRNTASFCTPAGFNLTNRLSITWAP